MNSVNQSIDLPSLMAFHNPNGNSFNYFGFLRVVNVPQLTLDGFDLSPPNEYFKDVHSTDFQMTPGFEQYFSGYSFVYYLSNN